MSRGPCRLATRIRPLAVTVVVSAICAAVGISHFVQSSFALTNGGGITALGVSLTENFDSLASTGTSITWVDNSTIPGWYSSRTTYNSGTGSSNTGDNYSYGCRGENHVNDPARRQLVRGAQR